MKQRNNSGANKNQCSMCIFNDGPFSFLWRFFFRHFFFLELLQHFVQSNKTNTYCIQYESCFFFFHGNFHFSISFSFGSFSAYFIITSRWTCISFARWSSLCVQLVFYFVLFLLLLLLFSAVVILSLFSGQFSCLFSSSIANTYTFLCITKVLRWMWMVDVRLLFTCSLVRPHAPCESRYVDDLVFITVTVEHAMRLSISSGCCLRCLLDLIRKSVSCWKSNAKGYILLWQYAHYS